MSPGAAPRIVEWDQEGTPEAFVMSMNLHRRHLDPSQRAMIAGRMANIAHGQVGRGHEKSDGEISLSDAADLLNVDRGTVSSAKKVLTKGTPEEIKAMDEGKVPASAIAKMISEGAAIRSETRFCF